MTEVSPPDPGAPSPVPPVRVAVVDDHDLVVAGVRALLAPFGDRVAFLGREAQLPPTVQVDLLLYDASVRGHPADLASTWTARDADILVFTWQVTPGLLERTSRAVGHVLKSATGEQLVEAIVSAHRHEGCFPPRVSRAVTTARQPAGRLALTAREAEIIAQIVLGRSNQEIADACFLSINSVKTYIRLAYRKIGVARRADAVRWGVEHGFATDRRAREPS